MLTPVSLVIDKNWIHGEAGVLQARGCRTGRYRVASGSSQARSDQKGVVESPASLVHQAKQVCQTLHPSSPLPHPPTVLFEASKNLSN